jgi:REP element-mobilizing transposase RayT
MYFPSIQYCQSIDLESYDYSQAGLYFVTLCTEDRRPLFGQIIDGKMHLNNFGIIANEEWLRTPAIRKNARLGAYVIMPNHFHAIVRIDNRNKEAAGQQVGQLQSSSQSVGTIIRSFKSVTTKRINQLICKNNKGSARLIPSVCSGAIWQGNYYEQIIRTERAYTRISNYIINNPKNLNLD